MEEISSSKYSSQDTDRGGTGSGSSGVLSGAGMQSKGNIIKKGV